MEQTVENIPFPFGFSNPSCSNQVPPQKNQYKPQAMPLDPFSVTEKFFSFSELSSQIESSQASSSSTSATVQDTIPTLQITASPNSTRIENSKNKNATPCNFCRRKHKKCVGQPCENCVRQKLPCVYPNKSDLPAKKGGKGLRSSKTSNKSQTLENLICDMKSLQVYYDTFFRCIGYHFNGISLPKCEKEDLSLPEDSIVEKAKFVQICFVMAIGSIFCFRTDHAEIFHQIGKEILKDLWDCSNPDVLKAHMLTSRYYVQIGQEENASTCAQLARTCKNAISNGGDPILRKSVRYSAANDFSSTPYPSVQSDSSSSIELSSSRSMPLNSADSSSSSSSSSSYSRSSLSLNEWSTIELRTLEDEMFILMTKKSELDKVLSFAFNKYFVNVKPLMQLVRTYVCTLILKGESVGLAELRLLDTAEENLQKSLSQLQNTMDCSEPASAAPSSQNLPLSANNAETLWTPSRAILVLLLGLYDKKKLVNYMIELAFLHMCKAAIHMKMSMNDNAVLWANTCLEMVRLIGYNFHGCKYILLLLASIFISSENENQLLDLVQILLAYRVNSESKQDKEVLFDMNIPSLSEVIEMVKQITLKRREDDTELEERNKNGIPSTEANA